jgi:hypothetical protein
MMGEKGSGKTKAFIEKVNQAIHEETGNVVCISKGNRYLFDLNSAIRMVDTTDFKVQCYKVFYGFICGIIARDYDITHIFIDSVTKIANPDYEKLEEFLEMIEEISKQFGIAFTMTISDDPAHATEKVKQYLIEY